MFPSCLKLPSRPSGVTGLGFLTANGPRAPSASADHTPPGRGDAPVVDTERFIMLIGGGFSPLGDDAPEGTSGMAGCNGSSIPGSRGSTVLKEALRRTRCMRSDGPNCGRGPGRLAGIWVPIVLLRGMAPMFGALLLDCCIPNNPDGGSPKTLLACGGDLFRRMDGGAGGRRRS
jgi:hypothetical protein